MTQKIMKRIMVFGTFDVLHKGHTYFLQKAKEYGDRLIVIVARDVNVKKIKGIMPKHNELQRLHAIQALSFVDEAHLGDEIDFFKPIEFYFPDIICFGYDQNTHHAVFELKKRGLKIHTAVIDAYMPEKYKSSLLRNDILPK